MTDAATLICQLYKVGKSGYEFIQNFQSTGKESRLVLTKFKVQDDRFQAWGEVARASDTTWNGRAGNAFNRSALDTLCSIATKVSDVGKLVQRYGLEKDQVLVEDDEIVSPFKMYAMAQSMSYNDLETWAPLNAHFSGYQEIVKSTQQRISVLSKIRWVLKDRVELKKLVKELKSLNDDLFSLLPPVDRARAIELSHFDILNTRSVKSLADIGEAEYEDNKDFSRMATLKSETLAEDRSGLVDEKMQIGLRALEFVQTNSKQRNLATWTGSDNVHRNVLVEWKRKGFLSNKMANKTAEEIGIQRIQKLVQLLASKAPETFKTLACLGYHIGYRPNEVGLVYKLPQSASRFHEPKSLADLIRDPKTLIKRYGNLPPLESRFRLAHTLAQALGGFHQVNWLHKGMSADNIIFFHKDSAFEIDIDSPYVTGFDFSRNFGEKNLSENLQDGANDRYRHPNHDPASEFRRSYDIYALGLVLLQIAFWLPLEKLADDPETGYRCRHQQRDKLIERTIASGKLRFMVGSRYSDAVKHCLDMGFDSDCPGDDRPSAAGSYFSTVISSLAVFVDPV